MMKINNNKSRSIESISQGFKIAMVILLFVLTSLRLATLFYFPFSDIISDKVLLSVVLFIVTYLWIQAVMDYYSMLQLNRKIEAAQESLRQADIDTIATLVKTEEAKDLYTSGHSERVTKIAMAIAEEMRLDVETKRLLSRASILHDIGKISISDAILNKTEKLSDADWQVIKGHPAKAVEILQPLRFLATEREIILSHHERYDGKGYPRGLKGSEIRLEALIIAVADAFDAMNSKRSYREPLSKETIVAELKKGRGIQHAPEVVDAFLNLLERKPALWER